jgi:tRNA (guanine-N7-)-methyltransferase
VIELVPKNYVAALDPEKIFGRHAPLQVDLGCGDGSFLCDLAQKFPEKNFLGIERLSGRVAKACHKAHKIDNVRLLQMETSYAVRYLLPPESVETFYLLFPDPWPKRRHHRRRIFTPEFLNSIHTALEDDGVLHIATDHLDYFQHIERLLSTPSVRTAPELDRLNRSSFPSGSLKVDRLNRSTSPAFEMVGQWEPELPLTKFEKRFRAQGAPIYRLALRKVSPLT